MRPDMHDRCNSISLLRYVPPEPPRILFLFSFCLLTGPSWAKSGAHEAVEVSCRVSS